MSITVIIKSSFKIRFRWFPVSKRHTKERILMATAVKISHYYFVKNSDEFWCDVSIIFLFFIFCFTCLPL